MVHGYVAIFTAPHVTAAHLYLTAWVKNLSCKMDLASNSSWHGYHRKVEAGGLFSFSLFCPDFGNNLQTSFQKRPGPYCPHPRLLYKVLAVSPQKQICSDGICHDEPWRLQEVLSQLGAERS